MFFSPDEPEAPLDDEDLSIDVFGHAISPLPEGAVAESVMVLSIIRYPARDELAQRTMSFRCTGHTQFWEARALLTEAREWIDECERMHNEEPD